jgi:hypothetical protein
MGILLTIQLSLAGIRTTGLTPHAAIAATASCIWPSLQSVRRMSSNVGFLGCTVNVAVFAIYAYPIDAGPRY